MVHAILSYRLLIWSENPDQLMEFYRDVLGLEVIKELKLPDDYGYALKVGDGGYVIWIGKHSKIHGRTKEPFRHILNLYVDDVFWWHDRLKDKPDVTVVAAPFRTPPSTEQEPRYAFTFLDPEGNCLQCMNP